MMTFQNIIHGFYEKDENLAEGKKNQEMIK